MELFDYRYDRWEEQAFVIVDRNKEKKTIDHFKEEVCKKLVTLDFLTQEAKEELLKNNELQKLSPGVFEKELYIFQKPTEDWKPDKEFSLPESVVKEFSLIQDQYFLMNDWNSKLYILETEHMFIGYAWETSA